MESLGPREVIRALGKVKVFVGVGNRSPETVGAAVTPCVVGSNSMYMNYSEYPIPWIAMFPASRSRPRSEESRS